MIIDYYQMFKDYRRQRDAFIARQIANQINAKQIVEGRVIDLRGSVLTREDLQRASKLDRA